MKNQEQLGYLSSKDLSSFLLSPQSKTLTGADRRLLARQLRASETLDSKDCHRAKMEEFVSYASRLTRQLLDRWMIEDMLGYPIRD